MQHIPHDDIPIKRIEAYDAMQLFRGRLYVAFSLASTLCSEIERLYAYQWRICKVRRTLCVGNVNIVDEQQSGDLRSLQSLRTSIFHYPLVAIIDRDRIDYRHRRLALDRIVVVVRSRCGLTIGAHVRKRVGPRVALEYGDAVILV